MIRISITGPESSGKTSLARTLAKHYDSFWVAEYAREYLHDFKLPYKLEDVENIAIEQIKLWSKASNLEDKQKIIFYDTDLLVIKIWCDQVFKQCPSWIIEEIERSNIDHYLLCEPDLPWENDPLRENPLNRYDLFNIYIKELEYFKFPYSIISGIKEDRKNKAHQIIDPLLGNH